MRVFLADVDAILFEYLGTRHASRDPTIALSNSSSGCLRTAHALYNAVYDITQSE